MQGFTAQHTIDVPLTRGDEVVTFKLYALPPGWRTWLASRFPQPMVYTNGKDPRPDESKRREYWDQLLILCLGKSLEPGGVLAVKVEASNKQGWGKVARAIFDEFYAAHLTDADLEVLVTAMKAAFIDGAPDSGN